MWKQSKISGVYLEASFIVITSKKDEIGTCHKKAYFLSHSNILMLSSGQTQLLQKFHWYFHLILVLFSLYVDGDITRSTMNSELTFAWQFKATSGTFLLYQINHEDHIAGKGFTWMTHYNFVHKFIPMPEAMKIPDPRAAVDKEWKKLETIPAWQLE